MGRLKSFNGVLNYLISNGGLSLSSGCGDGPVDYFLNLGDVHMFVENKKIRGFIRDAIRCGSACLEGTVSKELDREGSPGSPDYMWWEENVKMWEAKINVSMNMGSGVPKLSHTILEEKTYWTGY